MIFRIEGGEVELCKTVGMWIGIFDDIEEMVKDHILVLERGDVMLLYTDGITEAWEKGIHPEDQGDVSKIFGAEKLKDAFLDLGKESPENIKNGILKELENFDCRDDVTLVVVKRIQ